MKLLLQRYREETGATIIEFAMVAPVLIYLIVGIIEFGVMMTVQSSLEGSISQAARKHRALARSNSPGAHVDEIEQYMVDMGGGLIDGAKLTVKANEIIWGNSGELIFVGPNGEINQGYAGSTDIVVHYVANYDYEIMTPLMAWLLTGDKDDNILTLVASTAVENEPAIGGAGGI